MQKFPQLTLRDLFWLVALVALAAGGGQTAASYLRKASEFKKRQQNKGSR